MLSGYSLGGRFRNLVGCHDIRMAAMITKPRLALSSALAAAALLVALAPAAGAKPTQIDDYCSPSGDICQEITISKSGKVKFGLYSFTPAVMGEYTLCVKGPHGKDCKDFELESSDGGYSDKVSWQKEFDTDFGSYLVKWKYGGGLLGEKLRFEVGQEG